LNKRIIFFSLIILITISFSIIAYKPAEVVITGPQFYEQDYFIEELDLIAEELGIKIKYNAVSDPETFIIENPDSSSSLALIPNPQGVINLAERELIHNLDNILVDNNSILNLYSDHLNSIVSFRGNIYAGWTRLLPNSLIWYDISKFEQYNINLNDFDSLLLDTKAIADNGISPWCANSESSASTGWIQTNWMEDVLLTKYGPLVYDEWSNLEINASNIKIYLTIKHIEDFIFYKNHIHNGSQSIINKEFRNLPKVMLDDENDCFLSWSGHYFRYYIPEEYNYLKDYAVAPLPKIKFENAVVGIGDNLVLLNNNKLSKIVISKILSKNFGESWAAHKNSHYISANKNFDKNTIVNKLTIYEYSIVHDALEKDLFRYDASEVMARPVGSGELWEFFKDYIYEGPQNLVNLLNNLDKEISGY
tara:strand:+ start:363 stop:1625 length:1263 start_codon:yes stop_codon:yes gene_type:complete